MNNYVAFTGEENEKEFLIKCLTQWNLTANSERPDVFKIMELATVFSEMRHRIEELE
jgi:hypothetical protein